MKVAPEILVTACKRQFPSTTHNFESICSELLLVVYFSGREFIRAALFGFLVKLSLKNKVDVVVSSWSKSS